MYPWGECHQGCMGTRFSFLLHVWLSWRCISLGWISAPISLAMLVAVWDLVVAPGNHVQTSQIYTSHSHLPTVGPWMLRAQPDHWWRLGRAVVQVPILFWDARFRWHQSGCLTIYHYSVYQDCLRDMFPKIYF